MRIEGWLASAGVVLLVVAVASCGGQETGPGAEASSPQARIEPAKRKTTAKPPARREESPLPAIRGTSIEGGRVDVTSILGKRLLLFLFNPDTRQAQTFAQALGQIADERSAHNFEIVGIATAAGRRAAKRFVEANGIDYPVIDDTNASIGQRLGMRAPVMLLGVDAEGYVTFGFDRLPDVSDAALAVETRLRDSLRLPAPGGDADPLSRPLAPDFQGAVLDGDAPFSLAEQRGRGVALLFFLHTCPHCHETIRFLKATLQKLAPERRPVLVGVELTGRTHSVRSQLSRDGFDFFPVLFDDDGSIQRSYGVFGSVPVVVLIDAEGRIQARVDGWTAADETLMRLRLARLGGGPVPMLLNSRGYSGSEVCGVCHERELETWMLTRHASAFDTLVRHGADADPECVGCHVVGYGSTGGFEISPHSDWLEDVGCESCHGQGGPHLSPDFLANGSYAEACLACHDQKHTLGFEYASFLPSISHAANAHVLAMPAEERARVLAERGAPRESLLPTAARYVGSTACRSCHATEYERWSEGPHAGAVATLESAGKAGESECLACHTTAYGLEGGFPKGAAPGGHADLARVGCESCHGPGGDHVAEGAPKVGTLVSLGDKCDSCVILQICGTCHDDANDPGFEFEVLSKIEAIRHGTIEAGTGKPLVEARAPARVGATGHREAARLFAWLDGGEPPDRVPRAQP